MRITFLGTSASIPTKERNLFSIHLQHLNNRFLFDCGEGTQRQMFKAGLSPFKITAVFITHIHADHLLGLAGLLQTMNFLGRKEPLTVYGPEKIKKYVNFFKSWDYTEFGFEIKAKEVKEGKIFENQDCIISAFELKHSAPCYGYLFEEKREINLDKKKFEKLGLKEGPLLKELKEKGEITFKGKKITLEQVAKPKKPGTKIAVVVDTLPIPKIIEKVKQADVLICEATHSDELKEKSHEYFHMTAKDAAMIAQKAQVKQLILTHFSARYENEKTLEEEAKKVFKNTLAAKDLMVIDL